MATVEIFSADRTDPDDVDKSIEVEAQAWTLVESCEEPHDLCHPNGIAIYLATKNHRYEVIISEEELVEALANIGPKGSVLVIVGRS